MTKWEYVSVPVLQHAAKEILDSWGDDGWELVTIYAPPNIGPGGPQGSPGGLVAYFKRPKG